MSSADQLAAEILSEIYSDFRERGLGAADLEKGYEGPSMADLRARHGTDLVDFDLAMQQLEKTGAISTGPTVPYENDPNSGVVFIGFYSKRIYVHLTVSGYRKAQAAKQPPASSSQAQVQIMGSTIVQSPIGVGTGITQTLSVDIKSRESVVTYLTDLAKAEGALSYDPTDEVETLVEAASQGDLAKGKPLFQKIFGAASQGVRQLAWGVLSEIIAGQMGL